MASGLLKNNMNRTVTAAKYEPYSARPTWKLRLSCGHTVSHSAALADTDAKAPKNFDCALCASGKQTNNTPTTKEEDMSTKIKAVIGMQILHSAVHHVCVAIADKQSTWWPVNAKTTAHEGGPFGLRTLGSEVALKGEVSENYTLDPVSKQPFKTLTEARAKEIFTGFAVSVAEAAKQQETTNNKKGDGMKTKHEETAAAKAAVVKQKEEAKKAAAEAKKAAAEAKASAQAAKAAEKKAAADAKAAEKAQKATEKANTSPALGAAVSTTSKAPSAAQQLRALGKAGVGVKHAKAIAAVKWPGEMKDVTIATYISDGRNGVGKMPELSQQDLAALKAVAVDPDAKPETKA